MAIKSGIQPGTLNVPVQQLSTVSGTGTYYTNIGTTGSGVYATGGKVYMAVDPATPQKPKYWYRYNYYECPLCGSTDTYKERVYDEPKPEESEKRHIHHQSSACSYHFL